MSDLESETGTPDELSIEVDAISTVDSTEDTVSSFGHADSGSADERNLDLVMKIPVSVDVVLGSATMPVSRLMKLARGSVIALDRKVGEPIDVMVNGRIIARGEVVLMEDGTSRFGISLTEIVNARAEDGPADKDGS